MSLMAPEILIKKKEDRSMKNEKIVFFGIKPTRPLIRFVETHVEKWIARKQSLFFLSRSADYSVQIEHEVDYPHYHCTIKIRIGSREWAGYETGRSLHDALTRALQQIKPKLANFRQRMPSPSPTEDSVA